MAVVPSTSALLANLLCLAISPPWTDRTKGMLRGLHNPDILRGPRTPEWSCSCGWHRNWASRTRCQKCGKDAPTTFRDRAYKAHKQVEAWDRNRGVSTKHQSIKGGNRGKGTGPSFGGWKGPEAKMLALEEQIAQLRKENAELAGKTDQMAVEEDEDMDAKTK